MINPSALTGYEVENELIVQQGTTVGVRYHEMATIGLWALSCNLYTAGFGRLIPRFDIPGLALEFEDQKKLLALATSKIWRETKINRKNSMIFPLDYVRKMRLDREFFDGIWSHYTEFYPEQLWEEASALTLERKALETLSNLVKVERAPDDGVILTSWNSNTFTLAGESPLGAANSNAHYTGGIVYGAVNEDAMKVLRWLSESGFARLIGLGDKGTVPRVQITPDGHARHDEFETQVINESFRKRFSSIKSVFGGLHPEFQDAGPIPMADEARVAQLNSIADVWQHSSDQMLIRPENSLADSRGLSAEPIETNDPLGASPAPKLSPIWTIFYFILLLSVSFAVAFIVVDLYYAPVMHQFAPRAQRDSSWGSGAVAAMLALVAILQGIFFTFYMMHRRK